MKKLFLLFSFMMLFLVTACGQKEDINDMEYVKSIGYQYWRDFSSREISKLSSYYDDEIMLISGTDIYIDGGRKRGDTLVKREELVKMHEQLVLSVEDEKLVKLQAFENYIYFFKKKDLKEGNYILSYLEESDVLMAVGLGHEPTFRKDDEALYVFRSTPKGIKIIAHFFD